MAGSLHRVVTLVDQICTNSQIHRLLKDYRSFDPELRVSGPRAKLILHLTEGLERKTIPPEAVVEQLREAEENGRQHIFLFRCVNRGRQYGSANQVAENLFSRKAGELGFPKFSLEPDGYEWGDFRINEAPGHERYIGWTAKLYLGRWNWRKVDERSPSKDRLIREYERAYARDIWLVRYHAIGALELRISTGDQESRRTCLQDLGSFWQELARGGFRQEDFSQLDLRPAITRIVQPSSEIQLLVSNARFADGTGGNVQFNSADELQDIRSSDPQKRSIQNFGVCEACNAEWPGHGQAADPESNVRVLIGKYSPNHIRVGARASRAAIEGIVHELRRLAQGKARA